MEYNITTVPLISIKKSDYGKVHFHHPDFKHTLCNISYTGSGVYDEEIYNDYDYMDFSFLFHDADYCKNCIVYFPKGYKTIIKRQAIWQNSKDYFCKGIILIMIRYTAIINIWSMNRKSYRKGELSKLKKYISKSTSTPITTYLKDKVPDMSGIKPNTNYPFNKRIWILKRTL